MKELDNSHSLLCEIVCSDSKTSFAVVTIPMTVALIEVFTKELKLHLPSTDVWFFTVLKNGVEGIEVLLLPCICRCVLTYEEVLRLPVTILIVEYTL